MNNFAAFIKSIGVHSKTWIINDLTPTLFSTLSMLLAAMGRFPIILRYFLQCEVCWMCFFFWVRIKLNSIFSPPVFLPLSEICGIWSTCKSNNITSIHMGKAIHYVSKLPFIAVYPFPTAIHIWPQRYGQEWWVVNKLIR